MPDLKPYMFVPMLASPLLMCMSHFEQSSGDFDGRVKIEIRGSSSAREATKKSFSFVMSVKNGSDMPFKGKSTTLAEGMSKKRYGFMGEAITKCLKTPCVHWPQTILPKSEITWLL